MKLNNSSYNCVKIRWLLVNQMTLVEGLTLCFCSPAISMLKVIIIWKGFKVSDLMWENIVNHLSFVYNNDFSSKSLQWEIAMQAQSSGMVGFRGLLWCSLSTSSICPSCGSTSAASIIGHSETWISPVSS